MASCLTSKTTTNALLNHDSDISNPVCQKDARSPASASTEPFPTFDNSPNSLLEMAAYHAAIGLPSLASTITPPPSFQSDLSPLNIPAIITQSRDAPLRDSSTPILLHAHEVQHSIHELLAYATLKLGASSPALTTPSGAPSPLEYELTRYFSVLTSQTAGLLHAVTPAELRADVKVWLRIAFIEHVLACYASLVDARTARMLRGRKLCFVGRRGRTLEWDWRVPVFDLKQLAATEEGNRVFARIWTGWWLLGELVVEVARWRDGRRL
ncbi:hypothetical protein BDV95DRAFT_591441 [Massariosphaeria phaeospora]|uniref:Uncharacterized protein n=1 Tax=Massariosphaeria phaeospora TaxID=100035 RepID=A0A7C8ICC6_9PLEO|nr:hypothetical protein BDV95DRAFT_591441 [Massariosphaeria phaeospora]